MPIVLPMKKEKREGLVTWALGRLGGTRRRVNLFHILNIVVLRKSWWRLLSNSTNIHESVMLEMSRAWKPSDNL